MKIKSKFYQSLAIFAISIGVLSACSIQSPEDVDTGTAKKEESTTVVIDPKKTSSNKVNNGNYDYVEGDFSLWSKDSKTVERLSLIHI